MISYLSGIVLAVGKKYVILDVNGVGYRVTLPERVLNSLPEVGGKINLFIYSSINVREGVFDMYGFMTLEELGFFELLLTVSGIGPKYAQSILSSVDLQTIQLAIMKGDDSYLKKVSGIGGKTAQRMILELKNKIMAFDVNASESKDFTAQSEAMDALVSLGYSAYDSREALKNLSKNLKSTEDKIKEALKNLGKNKK